MVFDSAGYDTEGVRGLAGERRTRAPLQLKHRTFKLLVRRRDDVHHVRMYALKDQPDCRLADGLS